MSNRSSTNRTCKGICKKFQVKKPAGTGRYDAGQARCQICEAWISYLGCHLKNGQPATENSLGWFCNCCNYRVRTMPRNKIYKEKLKERKSENHDNLLNRLKKKVISKIIQPNRDEPKLVKNNVIEFNTVKSNSLTNFNNPIDAKYHDYENFENMKNIHMDNYISEKEKRKLIKNTYADSHIIENEVKKVIQNLKEEKHQSLEKKEDFVNLYFRLGSIKKVKDTTNQSEETIRRYTQTSKRLPQKLRDAHNRCLLSLDPKISLNIALHATDFFRWDGENKNQDNIYDLAMNMAKFMKKPEFKKN